MVEVSKKNIDKWLDEGNALGKEHIGLLEQFTGEYPYYGPTQALLAKAYFNEGSDAFDKQLRKAALTTADCVWLYDFIHNSAPLVENEQPVEGTKEVKKAVKRTKTVKAQKSSSVKAKTDRPKSKQPSKKIKTKEPSAKVKEPAVQAKPTKKTKVASPKIKKIRISPGEGEVILDLTKNQESLKAKAPKLILDETPDLEGNQEKVTKVKRQKKPVSPSNNSFLDWLDYTNLYEAGEKQISIVKPLDQTEQEDAQIVGDETPKPENNVGKAVDLLAKFIANKPKPGEIKLESFDPEEKSLASDSAENIPVSESLARVYISQNEVEMAEEVYQKLILKFPEKSAYFADLIQKLNKV